MQEYNAFIVLQIIRHEGPISRAELARKLDCSKSAISGIVNFLQEYDLIKNAGVGHPEIGRKSQLLQFNPHASFTLAVRVNKSRLETAIVDLEGHIHFRRNSGQTFFSPEELLPLLVNLIKRTMKQSNVDPEKIESLGVILPSIVNTQKGVILPPNPFQWEGEVPLATWLSEKIGKPVYVENNANAMALGESWCGRARQFSKFVYLHLYWGVGGAHIYNKRILHGFNFASADFGRFLVPQNNRLIQLKELVGRERLERMLGVDADVTDQEMKKQLSKRLAQPDENFQQFEKEVIDALGLLTATIMTTYDPQATIYQSPIFPFTEDFLNRVRQKVLTYLPQFPQRQIDLFVSGLDAEDEIIGAAAAALSRGRFSFTITAQNGQS